MFERAVLVHYHEIGLKGRNRATFERRLQANIQAAVRDISDQRVERVSSRLLVRPGSSADIDSIVGRVAAVPGVSSASPAWITSREQHDMNRAALLAVGEVGHYDTFAVDSRRSSTDHPVSSMDMNRRIGQYLVDHTGKRVNLGSPDVTCYIEVVQGETYVYSRKVPGVGGLPVGTAGTVVALLSSGIDSPVASWRMMKRGAIVIGVHFSGRPQTNDASERLVIEIGRTLEHTGGLGRIYVIPFGDLQKEISLVAPPALRVLIYRRLMIRVAEAIASVEGGRALVTGESLGQVASQTLENIAVVDEAATLPVLRPLIGMDKLEIIAEARSLGTYEQSIQEHADCCTLFMPRMPATRASVEEVDAGEEGLDLARMTADAVSSATYQDFACAAYRPPRSLPNGISPVAW